MAYSKQIIHRAQLRLQEEARQHDAQCAARRSEIFARQPRLEQIEKALRQTAARIMAETFREGVDPKAAMEKLREENLSLQEERAWLLESNELDPADLLAEPICTKCGARGYVGAVMCDCLRELCRQEQKKELSQKLGGKDNFEDFRVELYPDGFLQSAGVSPRELMRVVKADAMHYARHFSPDSPSVLMLGAPGLGKTLLAGCIAKAVADKGFSVCFETAGTVFADFETAKYVLRGEEAEALTAPYFDCELLVLDELGTELSSPLATAALYRLISQRMNAHRPTVVTTNLSTDELSKRYGASSASRLLGSFLQFNFLGNDVRMLQREG